jgi:Tfp pilus assembly protein PilN
MKRINLLPHDERVKASRERGLAYVLLALILVVVALGAVYVWEHGKLADKNNQITTLDQQIATWQGKVNALLPYQALATSRVNLQQTAKQIFDARVLFSNILQEISLVIPYNVSLSSVSFTVPAVMLPGGGGQAVSSSVTPGTSADVTIVGVTKTHRDVAEFMTRLGLIPQFTYVVLSSSAESTSTSGTTTIVTLTQVRFQIVAALRPLLTRPPGVAAGAAPTGGSK